MYDCTSFFNQGLLLLTLSYLEGRCICKMVGVLRVLGKIFSKLMGKVLVWLLVKTNKQKEYVVHKGNEDLLKTKAQPFQVFVVFSFLVKQIKQ